MEKKACVWIVVALFCSWRAVQGELCACQNGGVCVDGGPACECPEGYGGDLCDVPEVCVSEVAAGIKWTDTQLGMSQEKPCDLLNGMLLGGLVSRTCQEGFIWSELDITDCTVSDSEFSPTLLAWFEIFAPSEEEFSIIADAFTLAITESIQGEVQMLPLNPGEMVLTYNIVFESVPLSVEADLLEVESLLELPVDTSLQITRRGLLGFLYSSSCSCTPTDEVFRELCLSVALQVPCSCTIPSEGEELCLVVCRAPFYVGNGSRCTVDSEGDGFPDAPLDTCTNSTVNDIPNYCVQDVCPDIHDETQDALACSTTEEFSGCSYVVDSSWGITWANTPEGSTDEERCPDSKGFATRVCGSSGWQAPDVSNCESTGYQNVMDSFMMLDGEMPLMDQLQQTASLTEDIRDLTQSERDTSVLPDDLDTVNFVFDQVIGLLEETLTTDENITEIPGQNLLEILNNVLDFNNIAGWTTLQDSGEAGGRQLLDSAERYGLYLAMAMGEHAATTVNTADNIVIGYGRNDPSSDSATTFPESIEDLNGTYDHIPAQITIPPQYLREFAQGSGSTVPVTTMILRNMEQVLPTGSNVQVASMVISSQVSTRGRQGQESDALVENPVEMMFTFDEVENSGNLRCAFWEFSDPIGSGSWSDSGTLTMSTTTEDGQTVVTCQSTHLTSFAVLVDVSGSLDENDTELEALAIVSYIGCAISIICLTFAVIFFLSLGRNLFTAVHYFIHLNLALALLAGYIVFVFGIELGNSTKGGCVFVAALLHYFFLSAFSWMLCEGIMLYLMLVVVFSTLSKKWWFFLLIGWGVPIIPVVVGLAARHDEYGVEDDEGNLLYCWLSTEKGVIWAFVGPMLLIIIVNIVFLVIALVKVFQSTRSRAGRKGEKTDFQRNANLFKVLFKATIVLLPILGLTWVFGLLTVNRNLTVFAWLFTIFNSLQGVCIFVFHVLRSDKVWQSSRAKLFRNKASSRLRSTRTTMTSFSGIRKTSQSQLAMVRTDSSGVVASLESGAELTNVAWSFKSDPSEEKSTSKTPDATEEEREVKTAESGHTGANGADLSLNEKA